MSLRSGRQRVALGDVGSDDIPDADELDINVNGEGFFEGDEGVESEFEVHGRGLVLSGGQVGSAHFIERWVESRRGGASVASVRCSFAAVCRLEELLFTEGLV